MNYIRSEVEAGRPLVELPSKDTFEDEKYLQPVLEDDALLLSIDDILESGNQPTGVEATKTSQDNSRALLADISRLHEELQQLQSQFMSYRLAVKGVLDERLEAQTAAIESPSSAIEHEPKASSKDEHEHNENSYFNSYSFTGMLRLQRFGL